jgi:chromosome segregation protein
MYLKSLQLIGFKSFAEKTVLEFLPGVTAIVGPNGCGKSNIADAIRWVLGEQSAKALRGAEMADVIFNGTDGRKPISIAEVSMTFADVDPTTLSLPGVSLDFHEVTITRRVYRDGTGEYLINRTPCRLRDIHAMFMDTGMGRSSYSLMAQGQIDQILSAHPEDRRTIFEEAAGINKYKHQKKEALRKLEYTEANLVRLTDIIKEVKRQIISLQRQAGKARRYKELFDQLKALDTRLARRKFDLLQADIAGLETELGALDGQSQQFNAQVAEREQQVADLRRSLAAIEEAMNAAVSRDHELKNEIDRHQQRIGSNTERIAEFEQIIANHHREIAASEEKIRVQDELLATLNAEFGQIDGRLAAEEERLREQQQALQQLDAGLAEQNARANQCREDLIEAESRVARTRNELGALDHKKNHDVKRAERLSAERIELDDQRRALQRRREEFNHGLDQLRGAVESLRVALGARSARAAALSGELAEAVSAHHAAATELSCKRARLEVLQQVFAAPDGRVTLGNAIEVAPPHGAAVEAALNQALRVVLADNLEGARELLAQLANPMVACPDLAAAGAGGAGEQAGAAGQAPLPALAAVRVRDERFAPLVRSLLRNVFIADDLDAALRLRADRPDAAVATLRGEFVSQHGILSAIAASHIAEIGALGAEVAGLEQTAAERAARRTELEKARTLAQHELDRLRAELHEKEVALAAREGELNALATDQRDMESKLHTVIFELNAIEQQDAEEKQRREQLLAALQESGQRQAGLRDELTAAARAVDELQARREQLTQQLTELRVSVGGIRHQRAANQAQREPIAARLHDLRERIQTCAAEIAAYRGRIEQFSLEIAESEHQSAALRAVREQQLQQQLAGFHAQRVEVAAAIQQAEAELRALRQQAADAQQQRSALDIQLARKRMETQNLRDRVAQKYQVNLEEVRADAITITIADQGPARSQQVPLDTDWEALEAQALEMQSRLDAMGPVNVEAIQEYDELEERFKFLSQQHQDLVKAKEQLLQVIARINATTRQLFNETFGKVRENFRRMFTELFGGGRANLLLLDENDPLESGIEIVAQPPGKKLQSITLLSGGERTLTATALLFSIYMVKPSPFCVLDELDAPLDESNINRFIRILTRFTSQSQFVVITHNKRTIGMADALYGITMEEHGISKVVSVKFSPREETERRALERAREQQEDRIDGAAALADADRPDEHTLDNELLAEKEERVAPVAEQPPEQLPEPTCGEPVPEDLAEEVRAAVAAAAAVTESVKKTVQTGSAPSPDPV